MDANWYPDPNSPGTLRYWDGQVWTEHTAPDPNAAAPDGAPAVAGSPAGAAPDYAMPAGLASSTLFTENQEAVTTGRMTRQNPAVIKATLTGTPLLVSRGAMIAFQGDVTFNYQGSGGVSKYLKAAATGAKKAAGKVERAMSPKKPAAKRKTGTARTAVGRKTASAKSAVKKGMAKVRTATRKAGAAVAKAAKKAAKKPAKRTARKATRKRRA